MRLLIRAAACGVLAVLLSGCGTVFGKQYEYEEQFFFDVNGSARVEVDASVPALIALHGLALDPNPASRLDIADVRRMFEQAGCQVTRVGNPWRRAGRRFIQVILQVDDIRRASTCGPLAWASYAFGPYEGGLLRYASQVGATAHGNPGTVNWVGDELVAIKLHLPSKIAFQNVKRLEDGTNGTTERGNILTWEQRLSDRRADAPIDIEVRMEPESILNRTLWLFGGAFVTAVMVLLAAVALTVRKERSRAIVARPPDKGRGQECAGIW